MAAPCLSSSSRHASANEAHVHADIASQVYAKKVQALIKLITDLRALGAQSAIDLPRIAVIGNQSAGKSSLVEAMTKITVPRSQGTCTRCPMECRLSHSTEPFMCQIFLRIEKDEHGNAVSKVKETKFGPILKDKSLLEVMLRKAQLAILNPSVPHDRFVDLNIDSLKPGEPPLGSERQLQFSPNVVCIDIFSPDVTNLSFIDLPGIIGNVEEGEDPANIELIKNLVREHIAGNTLILLTITMRDDMHNQSAAQLARVADPHGTRTIGVLTKPDTLLEGEHGEWLDVLAGKKHPLTHGYYVTKQASTAELANNPTYEESRKREIAFFSFDSLWKNQPPKLRSRMGVPNLTMQLSALLSQLIEKTLPRMRGDSRQLLNSIREELQALPPPPSENPVAELLALITDFNDALRNYVRGTPGHESLIQDSTLAYESFREDILTTRPNFAPFEKKEAEVFQGGSENSSDSNDRVAEICDFLEESSIRSTQDPIYIDDVHTRIRSSKTRELPFNTPYQAEVFCIKECFTMWKYHARACFDKVWVAYQGCLMGLVKDTFEKYSDGGLYDRARHIIEAELDQAKEGTLNRIDWLLELEDDPFTLNENCLSFDKDRIFTAFREHRQELLGVSVPNKEDMQRILSDLAMIGKSCRESDLGRLDGPDPNETELEMMAEVAAYFIVAYRRIIDNLPRIIDTDFLKGLQRRVQKGLLCGLEMDGPDCKENASRLLSEDPTITSRRNALGQVQESLDAISRRLATFAIL